MLIVGVDPGLRKTGYGLINFDGNHLFPVVCGTIVTDAELTMGKRLQNIFYELNTILEKYKPDYFSLEDTFVNNNPITSLKLGQARGVAILCASLHNLEVYEYKPNAIKKSVTGIGKAAKQQVGTLVKYLLPNIDLHGEDEADALAVAICHAHHLPLSRWSR